MIRPLLALLFLAACGSTPSGSGDGGNPLPFGNRDGGGETPDGGSADGGTPWRILPGSGLDVQGPGGGRVELRVGQKASDVEARVGAGADATLLPTGHDRYYASGSYLLFYANTDQSGGTEAPTFTGDDVLRYLSAAPGFAGRTPGGTRVGDPRSAWIAEYGAPAVTLVNLDNPAETTDRWFSRGLAVTYQTDGGISTVATVSRTARNPDLTIQLRTGRLGALTASSNGSSLGAVVNEWGDPDQVDEYTIFGVVPGTNYTYAALGLLFVSQGQVGGGDYKVNGIVFFDPYYGKTDIGALGVRSHKSDFDASFRSASCATQSSTAFNQTWTIYRLRDGQCNMRFGVAFDNQNRARTLYLNFPNL